MIADPREMKLGLADYLALPEDEDREREIIRGKLYVSPNPGLEHQWILIVLNSWLLDYLKLHGEDPRQLMFGTDLLIDNRNTYFSPDLMYFSRDQMGVLEQIKRSTGRVDASVVTPVMALEVLSESNRARDLVEKLNEYEWAGIRHYWIIDSKERSFREFVLDQAAGRYQMFASAGGVVRPQLFAGNQPPFDLDLDRLFG